MSHIAISHIVSKLACSLLFVVSGAVAACAQGAAAPEVVKEIAPPRLVGPEKADVTLVGWGSTEGVIREAVEKLARNRRIDAVLLIPGKETEEIVSAIREDNPAPPPLFMGATELPPPDGVRRLSEREPGRLITLVAASLES